MEKNSCIHCMFYASKLIDSFLPAGAEKAPTFPGEAQRTQSKTILCKNELSKRILGTAIEVLSVKRGTTVVFYLLKSLRLCGEKHIFNLGILGNLAHFRHLESEF